MSKVSSRERVTVRHLRQAKDAGRRISAVTCYDSAFARLVNHAAIDVVLVGDSLGNVMLGHDGTIPVTLDDMLQHTKAVHRVLEKPFLCADMPFLTYHTSDADAIRNAGRLIQDGGAHGVKLEGGRAIAGTVRRLVDAGIPVMGHLGLTPQSVHTLGGYKVQGRGSDARDRLIEDALVLEDAGVFSLVLEMVPESLAQEVSKKLAIPTIGIGAGPGCDGQILVLHDLLGFDTGFNPKFLKKYANLGDTIVSALQAYDHDVKSGFYPTSEHSFKD